MKIVLWRLVIVNIVNIEIASYPGSSAASETRWQSRDNVQRTTRNMWGIETTWIVIVLDPSPRSQ
jgi:hypothetical protein